MEVVVRRAEVADVPTLTRMRIEFLAESRGLLAGELEERSARPTADFFERQMRAGTIVSWMAEEPGECIGLVSMLLLDMAPHPEDPRSLEGYVINMYVVPGRRRRGVAGRLMAACLAGGRELSVRKLMLYSTDDGVQLYTGRGFEPHPRFMDLRLARPPGGPRS